MGLTRIGAVAAAFGRDLEFDLQRIDGLIDHARREGVHLLVLPDAALGGYLSEVDSADPEALPPALAVGDERVERIAASAAEITVCFGFREVDAGRYYNTAVCLSGDGVLGVHRKVHQPVHEQGAYSPGGGFAAFDTPVGRLGMMIDYDKTFPESARTLALDGAEILACLCAWPTSITNRAPRMRDDRQSRLFDLYDQSRAAENQVVLASSNLTGALGGLRFLGQAKVVGPGGDIRARTWSKAGLVTAELDVAAEIATARKVLDHLAERRPELYR